MSAGQTQALEDRIIQLTQAVGVDGLQESSAAFVKRLRMHRDAILQALGYPAERIAQLKESKAVS